MGERILICDIDGVICNLEHRLHFIEKSPADWGGFFRACDDDMPMPHIIAFLRALSEVFRIVYITGRPESVRQKTLNWFAEEYVPKGELLMRADGDHRQDSVIKAELFDANVNKDDVFAVIEDRDQVVQMWREKGLLCLQNKKGDY